MSICIVTEAMEAYSEFGCRVPRHMDGGPGTCVDFSTVVEDWKALGIWIETYKRKHCGKQWWTLQPKEEILCMLSALPLNAESYQEISELVTCLFQ